MASYTNEPIYWLFPHPLDTFLYMEFWEINKYKYTQTHTHARTHRHTDTLTHTHPHTRTHAQVSANKYWQHTAQFTDAIEHSTTITEAIFTKLTIVGQILVKNFLLPWQNSIVGQGHLVIEDSRSHSDTPQSVRFLWTSDQPVAETCTLQHTTLTTDKHPCLWWDSNPQSQQASSWRSTP